MIKMSGAKAGRRMRSAHAVGDHVIHCAASDSAGNTAFEALKMTDLCK